MTGKIKLVGVKATAQRLKKLSAEVRKRHVDTSLRKGANVAKVAVQTEAPVDTGKLKASIVVRRSAKDSNPGATTYHTGVLLNAWYFPLVEFGTSSHLIKTKKKSILASSNASSAGPAKPQFFGTAVRHPGSAATGFFRRGWAKSRKQSMDATLNLLKKRLGTK